MPALRIRLAGTDSTGPRLSSRREHRPAQATGGSAHAEQCPVMFRLARQCLGLPGPVHTQPSPTGSSAERAVLSDHLSGSTSNTVTVSVIPTPSWLACKQ